MFLQIKKKKEEVERARKELKQAKKDHKGQPSEKSKKSEISIKTATIVYLLAVACAFGVISMFAC